jgi:hypothetical protein
MNPRTLIIIYNATVASEIGKRIPRTFIMTSRVSELHTSAVSCTWPVCESSLVFLGEEHAGAGMEE